MVVTLTTKTKGRGWGEVAETAAAVFRPPSPLPRHPDLPDPETGMTGTQTTAGAATTAGQTAGTTGRVAAVAVGMEILEPVEAVTAGETIMEVLTTAAKGTKGQGEGEVDQTGTTGEGEAKGHTTTGSQVAAVVEAWVVPGQDQAWVEEAATGIAVVEAAPAAGEGPVGPPGHPSLPFSAVEVLPCPLAGVVGAATTCLGEGVVASSSTSRTATKTTDTTHTIASPLARSATDHPEKKILLWFFPPLKCNVFIC